MSLIYSLFDIHPAFGIAVVAFLVTLLTNIVTKYTTDQDRIKKLKKQMKKLQEKMKAAEGKEEMQSIQEKIWPKQRELMKNSFKPFIYYGVPLLLVFGWLGSTLAYQPINPGQEFTVTVTTTEDAPNLELQLPPELTAQKNELYQPDEGSGQQWSLTASEPGTYTFNVSPTEQDTAYTHRVQITDTYGYGEPSKQISDSKVQRITVGYGKLTPLGNFNIFGWMPGWLATYIAFSIAFNILIRQFLDIA
jgi:uncharacterized membrane protein (DUF106 family)